MSAETDRPTPASIAEHGYSTWLWIDEHVARFPAGARRQLGHRIVDASLDALSGCVDAAYAPRSERETLLGFVNRRLSLLRILLRGARDRRHLSIDQHEHAMVLVDTWGRLVGGWLRAERGRR